MGQASQYHITTNPVKDKSLAGFTLLELVIVVMILSVLTTIAVSHLAIAREKALLRSAFSGIKVLQAAENVRFAENGTFVACSGPSGTGTSCYEVLKVDLFGFPGTFTYSVSGVGADFTAQVQRVGGTFSSCVYSINSMQTDPSQTSAAGTCP